MGYLYFFLFKQHLIASIILGSVALVVVIKKAVHWRYVLRDSLINMALGLGFAFLILPQYWYLLLALGPGALAGAIAYGSYSHASALESLHAPPQYLRLYPRNTKVLLAIGLLVIIAIQQVFAWRKQTEIQVARLIDASAVMTLADRSPRARKYLAQYFTKHSRSTISEDHLIDVCGVVVRLAESDGVQTALPYPAEKICRSSPTYLAVQR